MGKTTRKKGDKPSVNWGRERDTLLALLADFFPLFHPLRLRRTRWLKIFQCGWNPKVWPPGFDHSNESYWAVLSFGAVYCAVQSGSDFWVCGSNPEVWPFKWKLLSTTFLWCCILCRRRWFDFLVCGSNPEVWPFKWKLWSSILLRYPFFSIFC